MGQARRWWTKASSQFARLGGQHRTSRGVLLCGGHVVSAMVFGGLFLGLGLLSTLAVVLTKQTSRQVSSILHKAAPK